MQTVPTGAVPAGLLVPGTVRTNRNRACNLALSVLAWISCGMESKQEH
jgi:hypothetical protein